MRKVLLVRFGEVYLKGLNRSSFLKILVDNVKKAVKGTDATVRLADSRIYVADFDDMDDMINRVKRVFGLYSVSPAYELEKDFEQVAAQCVEMAKEALLTPLDEENPDPTLRKMEEDLFVALNGSGLGPMGLGGATTVLGVRIRKCACHTASLPVAVNIGCWATRRASARITDHGVEDSQGVRL